MTANWPEVPLAELCHQVQYGYTASATEDPIGPKFLRITDIVPDSLSWADVPHCQIDPESLAKYQLRDGDIVIARTGATVGYAKYLTNPPKSVFASYLVRFKVSRSNDPTYVGKVVESDAYKQYIKAHAGGAAQPNANAKVLGSFPVPLPPLALQEKIASVLAAYDELIENNLRRIEILEEMAQAIYQEWFVNFRYPGHQADEIVDSPLGPIPRGWEPAQLRDVADVNAASVRKGSAPTEINYIDISSVSPRSVNAIKTMPFEEAPSRARRVVRPGDTIWSTVRPNLRSFALVLDPPENTIASTGFAVLTPTAVPYSYLYQVVGTEEFAAYLTNHAKGAAYPAVAAEDFEKASILRPSDRILQEFHAHVAPVLELVCVLAHQNANLRETRDLLLPKLVSGGLDVSDLEIDTSWLAA